jgi:hypothetical protein
VTNTYVTIQNVGNRVETNLNAILQTNDEERIHPDKSYSMQDLPSGYEISLKLTEDTANNIDTTITVNVNSAEGVNISVSKASCQQRRPDQDIIKKIGGLFVIKQISPSQ